MSETESDAGAPPVSFPQPAAAGADITQSGEALSPDDSAALPLRQRVEAVLIVVDEPLPAAELARVLQASVADVAATLAELRSEYLRDGRGFELRDVAGGWRFYSSADCTADVERFVLDGTQARLTHAALETLAVVAYRQPVSRQSIAAIRGVGVDGVVRTLLSRNLIAEAGAGAGGATLYVTTPFFLSRLGLAALDELPSLAPYLPVDLAEFEETL
jgi:segregation and condensation protein B